MLGVEALLRQARLDLRPVPGADRAAGRRRRAGADQRLGRRPAARHRGRQHGRRPGRPARRDPRARADRSGSPTRTPTGPRSATCGTGCGSGARPGAPRRRGSSPGTPTSTSTTTRPTGRRWPAGPPARPRWSAGIIDVPLTTAAFPLDTVARAGTWPCFGPSAAGADVLDAAARSVAAHHAAAYRPVRDLLAGRRGRRARRGPGRRPRPSGRRSRRSTPPGSADGADLDRPGYLVVFGMDAIGPRRAAADRLRQVLRDGPEPRRAPAVLVARPAPVHRGDRRQRRPRGRRRPGLPQRARQPDVIAAARPAGRLAAAGQPRAAARPARRPHPVDRAVRPPRGRPMTIDSRPTAPRTTCPTGPTPLRCRRTRTPYRSSRPTAIRSAATTPTAGTAWADYLRRRAAPRRGPPGRGHRGRRAGADGPGGPRGTVGGTRPAGSPSRPGCARPAYRMPICTPTPADAAAAEPAVAGGPAGVLPRCARPGSTADGADAALLGGRAPRAARPGRARGRTWLRNLLVYGPFAAAVLVVQIVLLLHRRRPPRCARTPLGVGSAAGGGVRPRLADHRARVPRAGAGRARWTARRSFGAVVCFAPGAVTLHRPACSGSSRVREPPCPASKRSRCNVAASVDQTQRALAELRGVHRRSSTRR